MPSTLTPRQCYTLPELDKCRLTEHLGNGTYGVRGLENVIDPDTGALVPTSHLGSVDSPLTLPVPQCGERWQKGRLLSSHTKVTGDDHPCKIAHRDILTWYQVIDFATVMTNHSASPKQSCGSHPLAAQSQTRVPSYVTVRRPINPFGSALPLTRGGGLVVCLHAGSIGEPVSL